MARRPLEVFITSRFPDADALEAKLDKVAAKLDRVLSLLQTIKQQGAELMADMTPITDAVNRILSEVDDTGDALRDLAEQVRSNAQNPAAIAAIADQLTQQADELAADRAAVADVRTPAEPAAEEPPA